MINNLPFLVKKIKDGKTCFGMVVGFSDFAVSELAGDAGFDFVWLDMEHAPLTLDAVRGHIMATRGTSCAPFVRVPWNEHGIIKPILDLAPAGVIIPMINDAQSAASAVAACRYPPVGNRGFGVRRGNRYGAEPIEKYLSESAFSPMIILQIEHIDALPNIDEILKTTGIDSICFGPGDFSASMGKIGKSKDSGVNRIIDEICVKIKAAGLMLGTANADVKKWRSRGVNWIAVAADSGCIFSKSREILSSLAEEDNGGEKV